MYKKKHLAAMERDTLENNFLELQDLFQKTMAEKEFVASEKRKILQIAKPFFHAFDSMDLTHAKEMGKIQIGFLVTDLYKIVNEEEQDEGFSISSIFSKKEPVKKERDYKQVIIKIAEKLAEYGIKIPVSEPLKTTEEHLIFIKNQIENN
jgi:hypothetical protein